MDARFRVDEQIGLPLRRGGSRTAVRRVAGANRRSLKTVGLFAGIGGIELGLERAGHVCLQLCEIEPSAIQVLEKRFIRNDKLGRRENDLEVVRDVRDLADSGGIPRDAELLAAGFPCTDLSQAGKTAGLNGSQSGLIWKVFELLEKSDVPWVLIENVPNMLRLGRGSGFRQMLRKLESLGYRWAYRVVDSRAFNLPQRRQRVLLVASREADPKSVLLADDAGCFEPEPWGWSGEVACGFYWTEGVRGLGWAVDSVPTLKGGSTVGIPSPPAIVLTNGEIVTPGIEDAERLQGFRKNWTKPAEAIARPGFRWRLVGNAVSVPLARWLGERLAAPGEAILRNVREIQDTERLPDTAWSDDGSVFTATISRWPKAPKRPVHLADFLKGVCTPLSHRATNGFYHRAKNLSRLRFPDGFLDIVRRHLDAMRRRAA